MTHFQTANPQLVLRDATPADAPLIQSFLVKLMTFQRMADEVTATPARVARLLHEGRAEALLALFNDQPVGCMVFSNTSSVYTGRSGLYIDGFYVDDGLRGQGIGKAMMSHLSRLSLERGGEMLEWGVLDWNQPAIDFYKGLGAYRLDEMQVYRLPPDRLAALTDPFSG
jgi:ribosomal protein S18 acetylase RimI-like enzyme